LNNNHSGSGVPGGPGNVNVPMHSPGGGDSDSESDSGNEAGSSQNSGNGKKNPPQIYPWMKRVHLGTSEYFYIFKTWVNFLVLYVYIA